MPDNKQTKIDKERTNRMIKMFNQSTRLPRLTKSKVLPLLAVTALVLTAMFLRADPGASQAEHNSLAGTWLKANGVGGLTPLLTTFTSDGTLISSRCIIVPTGPTSVELVATGHGAWIRTGHDQFTATTLYIRSGPSVEFTGFVKTVETITLNHTGDEITRSGTLYVYDADNNLLFPPGPPGPALVSTRVTAGQ